MYYWQIRYPLCIALAAFLGYVEPKRPWRWALAVVMIQLPVMMVTSGNSWDLLPLGVIVFLVISVPVVVAACVAGRLAKQP
jgi:hypothetical protein